MKEDIYIISGTMASGKDAVLKRLKNNFDFHWVTSTTTRLMRINEKEGKPYNFITRKNFMNMERKGRFVECSKIYDNFYGITKREIREAIRSNKKVFIRVNEAGVKKFKKIFPKAITIFIAPPSITTIQKRIIGRGTSEKKIIEERLKSARKQIREMIHCGCDYITVNTDINKTVKNVLKIVN